MEEEEGWGERGKPTNSTETTSAGPSQPPSKPTYVLPARWTKPQPRIQQPKGNMKAFEKTALCQERVTELINHVKRVQPQQTSDYKTLNDTVAGLYENLSTALDTIQTLETYVTALQENAMANYLLAVTAQVKNDATDTTVEQMKDHHKTELKGKDDLIAALKKELAAKTKTIHTQEQKELVDYRTQAGVAAAKEKYENKEAFKSNNKKKEDEEKLKNLKKVQEMSGSITSDKSWSLGIGNRNSGSGSRKKKSKKVKKKKNRRRDMSDSNATGSIESGSSESGSSYSSANPVGARRKRRRRRAKGRNVAGAAAAAVRDLWMPVLLTHKECHWMPVLIHVWDVSSGLTMKVVAAVAEMQTITITTTS